MNFPLPNNYFDTHTALNNFVYAHCPEFWSPMISAESKHAAETLSHAGKRHTAKALEREQYEAKEFLRIKVKEFLAEDQRSLTPDEVVFKRNLYRFAWALSTVIRPVMEKQLMTKMYGGGK